LGHHGAATPVRTTDSRHGLPIAPNLLDRNFIAAAPNRIWLDVTYIETDQGWALSGSRHGPLQPQNRRPGDGRSFAHRTAVGGIADGHLCAAA